MQCTQQTPGILQLARPAGISEQINGPKEDRSQKLEVSVLISDINECAESDETICANGICENTQGGYNCICDHGYELSPDGTFCLGMYSTSTRDFQTTSILLATEEAIYMLFACVQNGLSVNGIGDCSEL